MDRFLNNNNGGGGSKRKQQRIRTVAESRFNEQQKQQREIRKKQLKVQLEQEEIQKMSVLLWNSTIEMFIHQILYVRRLYPQDSYCKTRFLNIQCYINRHPGIVKYIDDTVEMVTESLVGECEEGGEKNTNEGESNSMSVVLFEQYTQIRYEKFTLGFATDSGRKKKCTLSSTTVELKQQESDARDLILSILTLDGMASPDWNSSMTFRIELFLPDDFDTTTKPKKSSKLCQEYAKGKWFCTDRRRPPPTKRQRKKGNEGEDSNAADGDENEKKEDQQQNSIIRYAYRMKYSTGKFHYELKMNEENEEEIEEIQKQKHIEAINIALGIKPPKKLPFQQHESSEDDSDESIVDLQKGQQLFVEEELTQDPDLMSPAEDPEEVDLDW